MSKNYEVKITKQAQEQMREILHYISHELFAPDAAVNLLNQYGHKAKIFSWNY